MKEVWKDVVGYENRYSVSSLGRVKSKDLSIIRSNGWPLNRKSKLMTQSIETNGYNCISITNDSGIKKTKVVHRMVAMAFIENTHNKPCVNHKNGIKTDNRIYNLEWVTYSENTIHSFTHGLSKPWLLGMFGKLHNRSKPVLQMTKNGTIISEYESIADAKRQTGLNNISYCCQRKRKTAGGDMWKYK
jgi:hypothetical protein